MHDDFNQQILKDILVTIDQIWICSGHVIANFFINNYIMRINGNILKH